MTNVTLFIVAVALAALSPSLAQAQTAPLPTSYSVRFVLEANPGGTPVQTYEFQRTAALCNQDPQPFSLTTVVVNPRYVRFTDPAAPTRECVLDTGTTSGVLFALPFGRYIATMTGKVTQDGVDLVSEVSNASNPFVRGAAPARPVNVRVGGSH